MNENNDNKQQIINLFNENVKGKQYCSNETNKNHCGEEGHWLETKMKIKHNQKNEPDINDFEMKKMSKKITLGDFSASEYLFSPKNKRNEINSLNGWTDEVQMTKCEFIKTFGNPNPKKNNRYSWSGSCVPKYDNWNSNGQNLIVTDNNDIIIYYSYSKDTRNIKNNFPSFLQHDNIVIAIWKSSKLKSNIENKFNKNGFFICKKNGEKYEKLCFGKSFDFEQNHF